MTAPYIVYSTAGEATVRTTTLDEALRWQGTLHGKITQGNTVVAEAVGS